MAKVTLAKTKSKNSVYGKVARTQCWRHLCDVFINKLFFLKIIKNKEK